MRSISCEVLILFSPGWTLASGSPHLALPLLKGYLDMAGVSSAIRDLNLEIARKVVDLTTCDELVSASVGCTLGDLNEPYFVVEDKLNQTAKQFDGEWNAQLGFEYRAISHASSADVLGSVSENSPFSTYFSADVVPSIIANPPILIGFCLAAVQQLIPTFQLCRMLRDAGYDGFVVLGGNTVSRLVDEMAIPGVFDLVDGLVTFQGERPLLELYRALESGSSLTKVPRLIWRDADNRIVRNPDSPNLNANEVPTPDYSGLPIGDYWGVNYLSLVAARGCYWGKCSFCAIPYGWGQNGFAGQRSAQKTYSDIKALIWKHGINRFKFVDEALSPHFMRCLSELILADGLDVEWEGYTRLEHRWCNPDFVGLVGKAGFRKGYFGLEVLPSDSRKGLNKNDSADPELLLQLCAAAGIKVHFFCMFGYPGSGADDAERTVDFVLNRRELIDTADMFPWTYAKHTEVVGAERVIDPKQNWTLEYAHRSTINGGLDSQQVAELASRWEEAIWSEVPRFLHPTYRMVSPWSFSHAANINQDDKAYNEGPPANECVLSGSC